MRNFYQLALPCLFLVGLIAGCGSEATINCSECGKSTSANEQKLCEECVSFVTAKTKKNDSEPHYVGWGRDFEQAKEVAKDEGKSMLVLFTGSDWCPPCKSLHAAVFTSEEFEAQVPENLVLVVCDNPRDKNLVTEQEVEQYQKLSKEFKVSGVPSIFLTDAEGKSYHRMVGYGGTPAAEWVSDLMAKVQESN